MIRKWISGVLEFGIVPFYVEHQIHICRLVLRLQAKCSVLLGLTGFSLRSKNFKSDLCLSAQLLFEHTHILMYEYESSQCRAQCCILLCSSSETQLRSAFQKFWMFTTCAGWDKMKQESRIFDTICTDMYCSFQLENAGRCAWHSNRVNWFGNCLMRFNAGTRCTKNFAPYLQICTVI